MNTEHQTPHPEHRTPNWNIFQSQDNDRWYFHLEAPNHQIIAKSGHTPGYDSAMEALDAVRLVKRILKEQRSACITPFRSPKDKQWYFHLEHNKDILITSEGYKTSTKRTEGVNDVLAYFTCDISVIADKKMNP